ncbi:hypothetical protein [Kitasatospora sp. NPDC059599]|uniref:hypothetical protein n=1 Tax=Kitasatospora sp. NPDC059599 TaxID=3346880 RepID=UPI0036BB8CF0
MSGTVTCIDRAPAGTAAEHGAARLIRQGDGYPVAHYAPDGNRSARYATGASSTTGCDTKAVRRAAGRLHGGFAGPSSTESPHAVRPVPESR